MGKLIKNLIFNKNWNHQREKKYMIQQIKVLIVEGRKMDPAEELEPNV